MTHIRFGRSHVHPMGQLTNTRRSDGSPDRLKGPVGLIMVKTSVMWIFLLDGIPGTRVTGHPCPGTLVPGHFFILFFYFFGGSSFFLRKKVSRQNNFQVSQGLDEVDFFYESLSSLSRLGWVTFKSLKTWMSHFQVSGEAVPRKGVKEGRKGTKKFISIFFHCTCPSAVNSLHNHTCSARAVVHGITGRDRSVPWLKKKIRSGTVTG